MRIPRIYTHQALEAGGEVVLEASAARHLMSVLRLKPGDALILFNGRGGEFSARLLTPEGKQVRVQVEQHQAGSPPSPLAITLAVGLSKGDRMDWVIQKAVELGVQRICPLFTKRSEVKLKGQRTERKLRHWQAIAQSACEQSGLNFVPRIDTPQNLEAVIVEPDLAASACKLILVPRTERSLAALLSSWPDKPPASAVLFSGPEGGFSDEEVALLMAREVIPVCLGPRVLRAETAPLAACALLQSHWGDWR
ncbi:MAG TPA: 16S rRNA (uracil(1498)-N(3))-methyltransferase [Porticoccaceae bacterium]|nr:16S rRNA (uracil(1498)-N(3))-methyltransferase [Porticoccaceae bacterium]HCO59573.1 16S rRNA (uracil(1498)-N(3))-methyltransferase [Porticoccaceae bacterium]